MAALQRFPLLVPLSLALWALLVPDVLAATGARGGNRVGSGGRGGGPVEDVGNDDDVVNSFDSGRVLLIAAVVALVVVIIVVRPRRRRQARVREIRAAAAEAARDDPAFAAAAVSDAAAALYVELQRAWSERDDAALERGLGPDLLADWRRRIAAFRRQDCRSELTILEGPRVEYIGLVNREGIDEDRVTVAITATLNSVVLDAAGKSVYREDVVGNLDVSEYWTLARDGDGWRVVAIDTEQTSPYHLSAPIVPLPQPDG